MPEFAAARSSLFVALDAQGEARRTVLVDTDGVTIASLAHAEHGPVTWTLNEPEAATFTMHADDPQLALALAERFREVQMWRGDHLMVWGPIVQVAQAGDVYLFTVRGFLWYLQRRTIGKVERDNLLTNPDFDTDLTGWNVVQTAHFYDLTTPPATAVTVQQVGVAIEQDLVPAYTGSGGGSHTVVPGDTLWALALYYYGSGTLWPTIYEANQAQIEADARAAGLWDPRDPGHWIFPGQVFTIPGVAAGGGSHTNREWGAVWLFQDIEIDGGVRGAEVTFTAWAYVRSDEFVGYGLAKEGLYLARLPADYRTANFFTDNGKTNSLGGFRGLYSEPCEARSSPIDELHPFDQWVRHEVTVHVPPGETALVHARMSGPEGRTQWKFPRVTQDTAEEYFAAETRHIVAGLVTHAQDPAYGKTELNITVGARLTGVRRDLIAYHHDHGNVWQVITDLAQLGDGFDVAPWVTPTERVLLLRAPRAGTYKRRMRIAAGGGTVHAWTYRFDGEAAANSVGVIASTSGVGREEGSAVDADAFDNGLVLEQVQPARAGTDVDRLGSLAAEALLVGVQPETLVVQSLHETKVRWLGRLKPGDWVPVDLPRVGHTIAGTYRVVSLTLEGGDVWTANLARAEPPA